MSKAQKTASRLREDLKETKAELLKPERDRFEKLMSAYEEDGFEQEEGVVTMEEALRVNKILTQQKNRK